MDGLNRRSGAMDSSHLNLSALVRQNAETDVL